jgi:hypothetical protein
VDSGDRQIALVQRLGVSAFLNLRHVTSLKGAVMATPNRLSSSPKPLQVLVISLLLINAYVVNAQNNSNNTNTSNVNSAANNNTNVNANSQPSMFIMAASPNTSEGSRHRTS